MTKLEFKNSVREIAINFALSRTKVFFNQVAKLNYEDLLMNHNDRIKDRVLSSMISSSCKKREFSIINNLIKEVDEEPMSSELSMNERRMIFHLYLVYLETFSDIDSDLFSGLSASAVKMGLISRNDYIFLDNENKSNKDARGFILECREIFVNTIHSFIRDKGGFDNG